MKYLAIAAGAALLAGCAHQALTAAQALEVSETGAEALYVGVATAMKIDSAAVPSRAASDLAIWDKAWDDLGTVRALYAQGFAITGAFATLQGDATSASAVTGKAIAPAPGPVTPPPGH